MEQYFINNLWFFNPTEDKIRFQHFSSRVESLNIGNYIYYKKKRVITFIYTNRQSSSLKTVLPGIETRKTQDTFHSEISYSRVHQMCKFPLTIKDQHLPNYLVLLSITLSTTTLFSTVNSKTVIIQVFYTLKLVSYKW